MPERTSGPENGSRATITIKISREVREKISAHFDFSIDRTLRRLLRFKPPRGKPQGRPPFQRSEEPDGKRPALMTTARITAELHGHITKKARWNESIDTTLRRLLGIKTEEKIQPASAR
jgi:hypothetical protein